MKISKPIPLFSLEAQLKRTFRSHLRRLGFTKRENGWLQPPVNSKESIRLLHQHQRLEKLQRETEFISKNRTRLLEFFADGNEIDPKRIQPKLVQVKSNSLESDIFRMATLLWSVPVSQGYGRRLRYLVWDISNNRIIGLFALGDPVFNLNARDKWINWNAADRKKRLVNVMDCFVLGAVPPYNFLLSGKMIACMVRSREVWKGFENKYSKSEGIISGQRKRPQLILVTTTSALGRSSIYNRLRLGGIRYFQSIGFTSGWGHFHIPGVLYTKIREYLEMKGHVYADNNRFGDGPNWKLRTIRAGLEMLGYDPNILCHGIAREVFVCEFASNSREYLSGIDRKPKFNTLPSVDTIAEQAISRWIIPRSERFPNYKSWTRAQALEMMFGHKEPTPTVHSIKFQM